MCAADIALALGVKSAADSAGKATEKAAAAKLASEKVHPHPPPPPYVCIQAGQVGYCGCSASCDAAIAVVWHPFMCDASTSPAIFFENLSLNIELNASEIDMGRSTLLTTAMLSAHANYSFACVRDVGCSSG